MSSSLLSLALIVVNDVATKFFLPHPKAFWSLQVAWNYIVTYPLPLIAKSVAAATANGTAVNSFFLSNDHLSNYNDTGGVTPNHDTLYNQAFLDLSQVQNEPFPLQSSR